MSKLFIFKNNKMHNRNKQNIYLYFIEIAEIFFVFGEKFVFH